MSLFCSPPFLCRPSPRPLTWYHYRAARIDLNKVNLDHIPGATRTLNGSANESGT